MQIPVLLGILIILVLWSQYEIRKTKRIMKHKEESFWQMERDANTVRKVDITNLNYIKIPVDELPMTEHEDPSVNDYRNIVRSLSDKKILNLTGISNTELKLSYGTGNIHLLTEYDTNYTQLVSTLHKWGDRLYSLGYITDAIKVLECSIHCHTDSGSTYKLLASIYKEQNRQDKIDLLIDLLSGSSIQRKEELLEALKKIKIS
ncbi:MAG: hypothetical protein K0S47_1621 [Herbinix sp.]|jgi:hypothetical protein|nr:hypothetical protein [Herbinix sp.]